VPDVTGAEDVVDAVVAVEEEAVGVIEDCGIVEVVEVVSRLDFFDSVLS
jgi:hypothetical protein